MLEFKTEQAMSYEQIKDLPPPEFKRLCGVYITTFARVVDCDRVILPAP
ncbi:MAG: hypothetical protein KME21_15460 [Desmonostoc vinosum HA7617-LM4]|nr:hypothetical protein [Desmonostoc vinosum HA7617-LM4]